MSLLEEVKLMNGQPYTNGGHAMRMWHSFKPAWSKSTFTLSRSWVPRTILSSQNNTRLPLSIALLGISFILATSERMLWLLGVKLRGHVGVYLAMQRW